MGRNLKSSRQPLHVRLNICLRLLLSLDPPSLSPRLRNLGVLFDTSMSFISTCNSILNCADVISVASPKQLMSPLVSSSVDYCNCWTGSRGLRSVVPIVFHKRKADHPTNSSSPGGQVGLAWNSRSPYFAIVLSPCPGLSLCSCCHSSIADQFARPVSIAHIRLKTFRGRSFSFSGPSVWNGLSLSLRTAESLHAFQSGLKHISFKTPTILSRSADAE